MSAPTRILLLRHGLTDWNADERFQGQADVELNATGLAQARAVATTIADYRPSAIYSSQLSRALVTAESVAREVNLPIAVDERLTEINVGTWAGLTIKEASELDPSFAAALAEDRDYRRSPTGEKGAEVGLRMGEALTDIAAAHQGELVVVVSHGLAIRMGVAAMLGWDYRTAAGLAGISNCAWTILLARQSRWRLETYNRTI